MSFIEIVFLAYVFIYVANKEVLFKSPVLQFRLRATIVYYVTLIFRTLIPAVLVSRGCPRAAVYLRFTEVGTQTRQVNEDPTSFISFTSCDVTRRHNLTASFSFHFIKTSRETPAQQSRRLKSVGHDGGYRRIIIVVYVKRARRKRPIRYTT